MRRVLTKENQNLITEALIDWKKESITYKSRRNIYLSILFIPFLAGSIFLYNIQPIVSYLCIIVTIWYLLFVLLPSYREYNLIKKCNINNITTIKIGILRRKLYKQRKFVVCVISGMDISDLTSVKANETQFNKFKINDKIILFEYYPKNYAITYLPEKLKDLDSTLNKNTSYTPTQKDLSAFQNFRADITLYDNYLFIAIISIIILYGVGLGLITQSIQVFTLGLTIPTIIGILVYILFIEPTYPFKSSEIENCFKAVVLEKKISKRNSARKHYYGKKYYFINVIDSNGEKYENVRVLKSTYEDLKIKDRVICFDYRKESMSLSSKAAIKDINETGVT